MTDRREALRERLTDLAEAAIAAGGPGALRARDLAAGAGCALGAIYTAFPTLDDLVRAVNERTLRRLELALDRAAAQAGPDPLGALQGLALAYLDFADRNRGTWAALFAPAQPARRAASAAYLATMERLLSRIEALLDSLLPDLAEADRPWLARALFSAVHGMVALGLDNASAGLPQARIAPMLTELLARLGPRRDLPLGKAALAPQDGLHVRAR